MSSKSGDGKTEADLGGLPRNAEAAGPGAGGEAPSDESEALRGELESLREQLLRVRADTDNYRKRLERTTGELVRDAKKGIFLSVLGVADDLERAVASAEAREADGALLEGVRLTLDRLRELLAGHGVRPIEAGGAFDPHWHEAVAAVETSDLPDGSIVEEIGRGYRWGDEVLRAARVRVAVAPSDQET